jgi:hypothetical protein
MTSTALKAKETRAHLKDHFPTLKFSVRMEHYRSINIRILSGTLPDEKENAVEKVREFVETGLVYRETGDYGYQPNWYFWVYDDRENIAA